MLLPVPTENVWIFKEKIDHKKYIYIYINIYIYSFHRAIMHSILRFFIHGSIKRKMNKQFLNNFQVKGTVLYRNGNKIGSFKVTL